MAGVEISQAYVGMAGADIRSVNCRGMVSVKRKDREISGDDIKRVLEAAQSAALPSDRKILHAIPQEFLVDEQAGISEPIGMLGSRLEVLLHLVTGNVTRSKTLLTCINRAGIEVLEMVFEPLATAEAVLTNDERELGVLLLDLGAGTTEYALFGDGEVQHSGVLPVAAGHFTNDLAMVLRTPFAEAEKIKIRDGCCLAHMVSDDEGLSVPTVAGGTTRVVPRRELCEILQPRAEELFSLVEEDLVVTASRSLPGRRGAHRWRRADGRPVGDGGADFQHRSSLWLAPGPRRPGGRDQQSYLVHRFRSPALGLAVGAKPRPEAPPVGLQRTGNDGKPTGDVRGSPLSAAP